MSRQAQPLTPTTLTAQLQTDPMCQSASQGAPKTINDLHFAFREFIFKMQNNTLIIFKTVAKTCEKVLSITKFNKIIQN